MIPAHVRLPGPRPPNPYVSLLQSRALRALAGRDPAAQTEPSALHGEPPRTDKDVCTDKTDSGEEWYRIQHVILKKRRTHIVLLIDPKVIKSLLCKPQIEKCVQWGYMILKNIM